MVTGNDRVINGDLNYNKNLQRVCVLNQERKRYFL